MTTEGVRSDVQATTIPELLSLAASLEPNRTVFSYSFEQRPRIQSVTFRELFMRAKGIAAKLQTTAAAGDRVLVICETGLECIEAFYGCLCGGFVAVPVPVPRRGVATHVAAIARQCGSTVALSNREHKVYGGDGYIGKKLKVLNVSEISDSDGCYRPPVITPQTVAFLQYTSGSTSEPKGAVISHENAVSNAANIHQAFGLSPADGSVLWLPLYHDMGLMGGAIQSIYSRFPTHFFSPSNFMNEPMRWLELICERKATISGAPNFAYELCARVGASQQHLDLNLRSWRVAFNGSETVRSETMQHFGDVFSPCGFQPGAFRPCYGLAEATLLVSQSKWTQRGLRVAKEAFRRGRVEEAGVEASAVQSLVSVGTPSPGHRVIIVDPKTMERCCDSTVGEIWVSSPSVAQGYWERPDDTDRCFRQRLCPGGEAYLRTGDLGFVRGDDLYVTGRTKDVIIIRGRNYYPQDIERTVERSHSWLRKGCGAAFSIDLNGEERLVIVQEVTRHGLWHDLNVAIRKIRQTVATDHEVSIHCVVLIRPGTLPRTSSGKVRRGACREAYRRGELSVVAADELRPIAISSRDSMKSNVATSKPQAPEDIRSILANCLHKNSTDLDCNIPIAALGLDSLMALQFKMALEQATGLKIPISFLLGGMTIKDLEARVDSALITNARRVADSPSANRAPSVYPLSAGQRALWFLQELQPANPSVIINRLIRVRGSLDIRSLRQAIRSIINRHSSLRINVEMVDGALCQKIVAPSDGWFEEHDARLWSQAKLDENIQVQTRTPFDLQTGTPLRVHVYVRSTAEAVMLLRVHHMAADLWSLGLIAQELAASYTGNLASGNSHPSGHRPAQYSDYVDWQSSMIASEYGAHLWNNWRGRLEGICSTFDIGVGHRNSIPGKTCTIRFKVPYALVPRLTRLAAKNLTTVYSVLLAAFQVLLHRYSASTEFMLGILSVGRTFAPWMDIVGNFANPVVLRARVSDTATFEQFLGQSRDELLSAIDDSDFPFSTLVEKLHPARTGRVSPLVQIMCLLYPPVSKGGIDLSCFALGCAGGAFSAGDLQFESMDSNFDQYELDLVFGAALTTNGIHLAFHYDAAMFNADIIAGLMSDYITLLTSAVCHPGKKLKWLPLLNQNRRDQVLRKWNRLERSVDTLLVHTAIEHQVLLNPNKCAIVFDNTAVTYREMNEAADQLAQRLIDSGVEPEALVGVYLNRSHHVVIAMLAILKAGAAYVPLDPSYPVDRIRTIIVNSDITTIITSKAADVSPLADLGQRLLFADQERSHVGSRQVFGAPFRIQPDNLAYVIHTSGSTGRPKGVMISHKNITSFFSGMDERIGCQPTDSILAVTSVAFDISVLELLWTLSRGSTVVLAGDQLMESSRRVLHPRPRRLLRFSLFYFASSEDGNRERPYRLLLEGARLGDRLGFHAVWTPERHFHPFGGAYPNPSVTSAALATITEQIKLRAGSVVLPLQNPIRVAEEWAVVDQLSRGRVGVAFASGWHVDDFVLNPGQYERRREIMSSGIETVRRLWRGESVRATSGSESAIDITTYPRPVQSDLPIWLTAAGSTETFSAAARLRANVLTHLLGQSVVEVADRIKLYRQAWAAEKGDAPRGTVTLMLHAYLDESDGKAKAKALEPFKRYLSSSLGLTANLVRSLNLDVNVERLTQKDKNDLLTFAAERYMDTAGLFGSQRKCIEMVEQLVELGVDEVACLIDFGVDIESVFSSIRRIHEIEERMGHNCEAKTETTLGSIAIRHHVTMLQCTPSLLRLASKDPLMRRAIGSMRALMVGGERVPASLVKEMGDTGVRSIFNMYGPTETTVWSAATRLEPSAEVVFVGRPIANTQIYILSKDLTPLPPGVVGEVYIGGHGLARGYLGDSTLTAAHFLPDPFGDTPGGRLYRTGDIGKLQKDGSIELLGRADEQVKIRGYRIELGDVEAHLNTAPGVRIGVVSRFTLQEGDDRLVAFLVPADDTSINVALIREHLKAKLPQYMIPNDFHIVSDLPMTANGKVDRKALCIPKLTHRPETVSCVDLGNCETKIAAVWRDVLKLNEVSLDDNFFDVGGHSLLLVQMHQKLQRTLECEFPLVVMLENPTIRAIARRLEGASDTRVVVPSNEASTVRAALQSLRDRTIDSNTLSRRSPQRT